MTSTIASQDNSPQSCVFSQLKGIDGVKEGLYHCRLTITILMAIHLFGYLFVEDPEKFICSFKFFTCWSELITLLYFVYLMYSNPFTVNIPAKASLVEQAILMMQVTVVLVYWTILVPNIGLGAAPQQKYFAVYVHTIPFLGKLNFTQRCTMNFLLLEEPTVKKESACSLLCSACTTFSTCPLSSSSA